VWGGFYLQWTGLIRRTLKIYARAKVGYQNDNPFLSRFQMNWGDRESYLWREGKQNGPPSWGVVLKQGVIEQSVRDYHWENAAEKTPWKGGIEEKKSPPQPFPGKYIRNK